MIPLGIIQSLIRWLFPPGYPAPDVVLRGLAVLVGGLFLWAFLLAFWVQWRRKG